MILFLSSFCQRPYPVVFSYFLVTLITFYFHVILGVVVQLLLVRIELTTRFTLKMGLHVDFKISFVSGCKPTDLTNLKCILCLVHGELQS